MKEEKGNHVPKRDRKGSGLLVDRKGKEWQTERCRQKVKEKRCCGTFSVKRTVQHIFPRWQHWRALVVGQSPKHFQLGGDYSRCPAMSLVKLISLRGVPCTFSLLHYRTSQHLTPIKGLDKPCYCDKSVHLFSLMARQASTAKGTTKIELYYDVTSPFSWYAFEVSHWWSNWQCLQCVIMLSSVYWETFT